ncbi:T9SS type A sorting domain-containing protein [Flavobacterium sp.]|uniref:T9SS type A sorting domain-containing protein n=1 Tax=Flavobacterium sp. TaxID=239 RepID=UPI00286C8A57|nr:T9SS type A sorting domain-containing protein [Flavobacterium sp.]
MKNMITTLLLLLFYWNSNAQSWQLWATGLPAGSFPKLEVAANHDIFYGLVAGPGPKGIIYKANTNSATGVFSPMPTIPVPVSITNNIQAIISNSASEPIVGVFRTNTSEPFLFKYSNTTNTWSSVAVDFPASLGAFCMAKSPNGNLWVGAKWANIFKSTDNGSSFIKIDESALVQSAYPCYYPSYSGNAIDGAIYSINVDSNGRLYAGTEGAGVIYSDDNGASFHPADFFVCQATNPTLKNTTSPMRPLSDTGNLGAIGFTFDNNLLFNGTNMFSVNWTQSLGFANMTNHSTSPISGIQDYFIGSGLQVSKIVTTANGHVFFHSGSNNSVPTGTIGIYTSTDGINWSLFNTCITGLNDGQSQGGIAVDGNKVYFATHDGKIFVFDATTLTSTNFNPLNDEIKVYPNPTSNLLNFDRQENTPFVVKVYNLLGEIIIQKTVDNKELDISNLTQGMYLIQCNISEKTVTRIIFKK